MLYALHPSLELSSIVPDRYHYHFPQHVCRILFVTSIACTMPQNTLPVPSTHQTASRARRTNGATQTFRRPSHATSLSGSTAHSASRDVAPSQNSSNSGVYVPPHAQPGRNGSSAEGRFSRDQLTQLFRTQRDGDELADGLGTLSMGAWDSHATNGASAASWGRNHDASRDVQSGVDQCWDRDGSIEPLSLRNLTDEERDVRFRSPHMCSQPFANVHSSLRSSCRPSTRR
jgi:PERQ amino acid-rich with GYF domain-containing protein